MAYKYPCPHPDGIAPADNPTFCTQWLPLGTLGIVDTLAMGAGFTLCHQVVQRRFPWLIQSPDWTPLSGIVLFALQVLAMTGASVAAWLDGRQGLFSTHLALWFMQPRMGFILFLWRYCRRFMTEQNFLSHHRLTSDLCISENLLNIFTIGIAIFLEAKIGDKRGGCRPSPLTAAGEDYSRIFHSLNFTIALGIASIFILATIFTRWARTGPNGKTEVSCCLSNSPEVNWGVFLFLFIGAAQYGASWVFWNSFQDLAARFYCPGSLV